MPWIRIEDGTLVHIRLGKRGVKVTARDLAAIQDLKDQLDAQKPVEFLNWARRVAKEVGHPCMVNLVAYLDDLQAENVKLRDTLLQLAKDCPQCDGSGSLEIIGSNGLKTCPKCAHLRAVLR